MDFKMVRAFKAKVNETNARRSYKDAPLEFKAIMFQDGQWAVTIRSKEILSSFVLEDLLSLSHLFGLLGFISSHDDVLSYHIQ